MALEFNPEIDPETRLPVGLEFESVFDNTRNVNGVIGTVKRTRDGKRFIFKICKYFENSVRHEWVILEGLNKLSAWCPHFVKGVGLAPTQLNDNFKHAENTFARDPDRKQINKEVLYLEYVEGISLSKFIKKAKTKEHIFAVAKQVLNAVITAQLHSSLAHYDLHDENIIVKKSPLNAVNLYLYPDRSALVPTYGYCPVIIDFGHAYSNDCLGRNMDVTCAFTHHGYTSTVFDPNKDFKVFLCKLTVTLLDHFRMSKICKNARALIEELYENDRTDVDNGWEDFGDEAVLSMFEHKVFKVFKEAEFDFFEQNSSRVLPILEGLVELPLTQNSDETAPTTILRTIVAEFSKIERILKEEYYKLYILKTMVDSAVRLKKTYLSKDTTKREGAVSTFRADVLAALDQVAKFADVKGIKWEKLFCAFLVLGRSMGKYFNLKIGLIKELQDEIKPPLTPSEIYDRIDPILVCPFFYNTETTVHVWDVAHQRNWTLPPLPKTLVDKFNATDMSNADKIKDLLAL